MTDNYLNLLAETIRKNWDQPALTDFYLTEDGSAQDTSCGNHYTYGEMYAEICRIADLLTALGLQKGDHIAICGTNSAKRLIGPCVKAGKNARNPNTFRKFPSAWIVPRYTSRE